MSPRLRIAVPLAAAALLGAAAPASARTVQFAGRTWDVRATTGAAGPGPNVFSASTSSVWVDAGGALHLKIRRERGRWVCAEVVAQGELGNGRYAWSVASPVDTLDANAVLGLFSYRDDTHEIDVEATRWGNPFDPANAQFTVQPFDHPGNLWRFTVPTGPTRYGFTWGTSAVDFTGPGAAWSYTGPDVPVSGGARVHMNLWLYGGAAPAEGKDVEVVLRSFAFTPA